VGMILNKLAELGIDENTMVIFCSDNGPHQEGNHAVEFFNSNRELRGSKRDFYDGGIRTPFIVRWPGKITAGSKSEQTFAFWDVLPTFANLLGTSKPANTDGISFLPALMGQEQKESHDYLYWEFFELGGKQAILKDKWKAIRLNVRGGAEKIVVELYNLETDPEEKINVAQQNPELVREFEALFISAREEFSVTPLFSADEKTVETPF
jgi:arylsulfatase A-like enzyme